MNTPVPIEKKLLHMTETHRGRDFYIYKIQNLFMTINYNSLTGKDTYEFFNSEKEARQWIEIKHEEYFPKIPVYWVC